MKLKLSPRDKNSIFAFLTIIIVLLTVTVMMFPEFIDYSNSLSHLSDKSDSIEAVANKLEQNEKTIKSLNEDIAIKQQDSEKIKEEADLLRARVNTRSFDLHIPSLLVTLEETARNKDIAITIEYSQLTNSTGDFTQIIENNYNTNDVEEVENVNDEIIMTNPEDEDNVSTEENIIPTDGESLPISESKVSPLKNNSSLKENTTSNKIDNVVDSGMSVASVPIKVEGNFLKIRDFIQMLDDLDFVEPVHIELESDGEIVQAGILINIYYGEVN